MKRTYWMGLVVAILVAAAGLLAYRAGLSAHLATSIPLGGEPAQQSGKDDASTQELAQIRAAEQIEDPLERCLAYPDPHEFSWDRKVVEALCRRSVWRMISGKEIEDALNAHHPELIDQAFDAYLAANYADPKKHGYLTWAFWWMFESSSAWTEQTTRRWVEMDPASAYALTARGIHYAQSAWDARGGKSYAKTPADHLENAQEFVVKAQADLQESLRRNPRLIAAYHGLLYNLRLADDSSAPKQQWIDAALALDRADPWIYEDWIDTLAPEWGGSTVEMTRVAERAASHASDNPLLGTLKAEPLCNQGDQYRCNECKRDGAKALDFYIQAGGFGPSSCFLQGGGAAAVQAEDSRTAARFYSQAVRFLGTTQWLAYRAPTLRSIGQNEWALRDLKTALQKKPHDSVALFSQGISLEELGRYGDAEQSYLSSLESNPADQRVEIRLIILYLSPTLLNTPERSRPWIATLLAQEPKLAQGWLLKAALSEHDKDAHAYLVDAQNYLQFVDHDDPAQQSDIRTIQAKLVEVQQILKIEPKQ